MSNVMPLERLDAPESRWLPAVTIGPYALLAALLTFTIVDEWSRPRSMIIDAALCGLTAVWILVMFTLRPAWRVRPRIMAVFFTGIVAVTAVLVVRDPWFGFFTPAGYFYAFSVLRWPWRLAGVSAVAVMAATAQTSGIPRDTILGIVVYLAVIAVNVGPMCGLAWMDWAGDNRNDERERALREVSEANRRLEATLAENAGLHQQLLAQAREAGVLDERARMAREIHDTLAQGLTGIITQLQAAEHASADPQRWRRHLDAAIGLARESLSEARRSVHELRPEPLETSRLGDALAGVADRFTALHGIDARVTTTGDVCPIPPEAEFALLRTAQEALANVARHARARRVGLTLSYVDGEVVLDVRDDGVGFPAGTPGDGGSTRGGGFGLTAMRQRIEALAGSLRIESEPGAGTTISASLPRAAAVTP